MARGELDFRKFKGLDRKTIELTDEQALQVQQKVLPGAFDRTARGFTDQLARQVFRIDPDAALKRAKTVHAQRCVEHWVEDDGQAVILLRGPIHEIRAAWNCLCHEARLLTRDGRTLGNKAFDIGIDKMTSNILGPVQRATMVNVNVDLTTLLGLDNKPGTIEGTSEPIPAPIIRKIAQDEHAWLRRILKDEHGRIVDISNKYRPTTKQRAKAQLRQQTCAVPGCNHPATTCELDHGNPYSATGKTDLADMAALCRRHHRYKHLGILTWTRIDEHHVEFHYRTRPEDFPDEPPTRARDHRRHRKPSATARSKIPTGNYSQRTPSTS